LVKKDEPLIISHGSIDWVCDKLNPSRQRRLGMATPHIQAQLGDFAKTVLMPGDPLRAKFIADNFLTDVRQVNTVRNMFGYTGKFQGKLVSVMASGMGMPSMGIYSHELYTAFGVETIIRVGTAGAYHKQAKLFDIMLAQGASTDSAWASQFQLRGGTFSALATYHLLEKAVQVCQKQAIPYHVGNMLSSDVFYDADPDKWKKWEALGLLGVEMEAYALYANAARLGKQALAIMTVSDSFHYKEILTAEQREQGLKRMLEVALTIAP
jgi:purine-nucleoside phosphorylase